MREWQAVLLVETALHIDPRARSVFTMPLLPAAAATTAIVPPSRVETFTELCAGQFICVTFPGLQTNLVRKLQCRGSVGLLG